MAGDNASFKVGVYAHAEQFMTTMAQVRGELGATNLTFMDLASSGVNSLKTLGMVGAGSLIAMVAPTFLAASAVGSFDANLRRIVALSNNEFAPQMGEMTQLMNEFAIQYGQSADEVSAAAIEFVKTGYAYNEIFGPDGLLAPAMQLAIANQIGVADAATIANNAFKLWANQDPAAMMNLIHVAANSAKLDVMDLGTAFQYVGSSASIAGMDFQDFLALAAGLSQIGVELGETYGTFITKILTSESSGNMPAIFMDKGIIENGVINMEALMEIFSNADQFSLEEWNQAFTSWGVRPARNMMQLRAAAQEILKIKDILGGASGQELAQGAKTMSLSIEAVMTSLQESVLAPLRNPETLAAISAAIISIAEAFTDPRFVNGIRDIVETSADFIVAMGPTFVNLIANMVIAFQQLTPALENGARAFVGITNALGPAFAPMVEMVATILIMKQIMPKFIADFIMAKFAVAELNISTMALLGSTAAITAGFMLFMNTTDPLVQWAGIAVMVIGTVAAALWGLYVAESAASAGLIAVTGGAGVAMALATMATASSATASVGTAPASAGAGGGTTLVTGGSTNTNNDNRTFIINDVGSSVDAIKDAVNYGSNDVTVG